MNVLCLLVVTFSISLFSFCYIFTVFPFFENFYRQKPLMTSLDILIRIIIASVLISLFIVFNYYIIKYVIDLFGGISTRIFIFK